MHEAALVGTHASSYLQTIRELLAQLDVGHLMMTNGTIRILVRGTCEDVLRVVCGLQVAGISSKPGSITCEQVKDKPAQNPNALDSVVLN